MALAHFKHIADATDLPLIVLQYPLATGELTVLADEKGALFWKAVQ